MKLADIVKVIANELGTSDLKEINKQLKVKPDVKFRITGKNLKNLGFTGQIKSISEEGIKAYMTNKVSLIRLEEIETFEKRKSSEWYAKPAQEKTTPAQASVKKIKKPAKHVPADDDDEDDDDDFDDDDDNFEEVDIIKKKPKKNKSSVPGKQGSKFIPLPKKK